MTYIFFSYQVTKEKTEKKKDAKEVNPKDKKNKNGDKNRNFSYLTIVLPFSAPPFILFFTTTSYRNNS